jgi:AcrR family transcriptional regulator
MRPVPRPRARLDPAALTRAFAPDGLHGTSSAAVARSAGVAKPTVYAHAGSKEGAFAACVDAEVERLLTLLSEAELASRSAPARVRLAALAAAIIRHGRESPAAARLLHQTARHASSSVAAEVDAALARLPARIVAILRRDATPERAEIVAVALLGAASALALRAASAGGMAVPSAGGTRVHAAGGTRVHAASAVSGAWASDPEAVMLGEALAAMLDARGDDRFGEPVQSVGVY